MKTAVYSAISFISYGLVPFLVLYFIMRIVPMLSLSYNIYLFLVFGALISVFTFFKNYSKDHIAKLSFLSLDMIVIIAWLTYLALLGHFTASYKNFQIIVNYSSIFALFYIIAILKFSYDVISIEKRYSKLFK